MSADTTDLIAMLVTRALILAAFILFVKLVVHAISSIFSGGKK